MCSPRGATYGGVLVDPLGQLNRVGLKEDMGKFVRVSVKLHKLGTWGSLTHATGAHRAADDFVALEACCRANVVTVEVVADGGVRGLCD
jgi:hypothetical protein